MRDWGLPAAWAPRLPSLLRTVSALLFLEHGSRKLLGFPPMRAGGADAALRRGRR